MTIQLTEYVRKPFVVQAVQVTADNMDEVARWCSGTVKKSDTSKDGGLPADADVYYIKVEVKRPLEDRQTRAHIGDFVLAAGQSFKVYTEYSFNKSFMPHEPKVAPKSTPKKPFSNQSNRRPRPKPPTTGPRPTPPAAGPDLSPITVANGVQVSATGTDVGVTPIHSDQLTLVQFHDAGFPDEPSEMRETHIQAAENVGLTPAQVQGVLNIYSKVPTPADVYNHQMYNTAMYPTD